jgi:hypothetical protein
MNIIIDSSVNNFINSYDKYNLKIQEGRLLAIEKKEPQQVAELISIFKQILSAAKLEDSASVRDRLLQKLDISLCAKNIQTIVADFLNEKEPIRKNAWLAHFIFEKILLEGAPRDQRMLFAHFFDALAGEKKYRLHALCKYGNYSQIYEWIAAELDDDFCDFLDDEGHSPLYNLFRSFHGSRETVNMKLLIGILNLFQEKSAAITVAAGQEKEYETIFPYVCLYGERSYIEDLLTKMLKAGLLFGRTYNGHITPLYSLLSSFGYDLEWTKHFFDTFYPQFYAKGDYFVAREETASTSVLRCLLSDCFPEFARQNNEVRLTTDARVNWVSTQMNKQQQEEYVAFIKSVVTTYPKLLEVTLADDIWDSLVQIDRDIDGGAASDLFSFFIEKGVKVKAVGQLFQKNPIALMPLLIQHAETLPEDMSTIFDAMELQYVTPFDGRREQISDAIFARKAELQKNPKLARSLFENLLRTNFNCPKEAVLRKFFSALCPDAQYMLHEMCLWGSSGLVRDMILDALSRTHYFGLDPRGHSPLYNFFLSLEHDDHYGSEYTEPKTIIWALDRAGATLAVAQGQESDYSLIAPYVCRFVAFFNVRWMISMILSSGCSLHRLDREGHSALYTLLCAYANNPENLQIFLKTFYPSFQAQKVFSLSKERSDNILSFLLIHLGSKIYESEGYMTCIKTIVDQNPELLNIEASRRARAMNPDSKGSGNALNLLLNETMPSRQVMARFRELFAYFIEKGAKIVDAYEVVTSLSQLKQYDLVFLVLQKKPVFFSWKTGWNGWMNFSPAERKQVLDLLLAYVPTEPVDHIPITDIFLLSRNSSPEVRRMTMEKLLGLTTEEVELLPYQEEAVEMLKTIHNHVTMFPPEKIAYIATLFGDYELAVLLRQEIGRDALCQAFRTLTKRMPHWKRPAEALALDLSWKVSPAHLQTPPPMLPEGEPQGVKLDDILTLFDTLREEDVEAIAKDSSLPQGKEGSREMRERLEDDIYRIKNKKRRQRGQEPLPQDVTPEQKELYYQEVLRARLWTVAKLKEKNDPVATRQVLAEYVAASPYCGAPFFQVSVDQFQNLMTGAENSGEVKISSAVAALRVHVMKQVSLDVAATADRDEPNPSHPHYYASQSVHFYNGLVRELGGQFAIPHAALFSEVSDPYPYFENHYKRNHPTWKKDVEKRFFRLYSPSKIVETVTSRLEEVSEDSLIDCVKKSMPEAFGEEESRKKMEEAQKLIAARTLTAEAGGELRVKKEELIEELLKRTGETIAINDEAKSLAELEEKLLVKVSDTVLNPIKRQNATNFIKLWIQSHSGRGQLLEQLQKLNIGIELSDEEFLDATKISERVEKAIQTAKQGSYLAQMTAKVPGKKGLELKVDQEGVLNLLGKIGVISREL